MAITLDGTAGINTSGTLVATGSLTTSSSLTTGTGAIYNGIQSSTTVASTSGTSIDFISIPAWVKRITIMGSGVVAGTGVTGLRLGTSSGFVSTGYTAASNNFTGSATGGDNNTTYFYIRNPDFNGAMTLNLLNASTNTWTFTGISSAAATNTGTALGSGVISLASTLTQIRIFPSSGSFSAGSINILYE